MLWEENNLSDRIKCQNCSNQILLSTADTTGGFCMVCHKANNPKVVREKLKDNIMDMRKDKQKILGFCERAIKEFLVQNKKPIYGINIFYALQNNHISISLDDRSDYSAGWDNKSCFEKNFQLKGWAELYDESYDFGCRFIDHQGRKVRVKEDTDNKKIRLKFGYMFIDIAKHLSSQKYFKQLNEKKCFITIQDDEDWMWTTQGSLLIKILQKFTTRF